MYRNADSLYRHSMAAHIILPHGLLQAVQRASTTSRKSKFLVRCAWLCLTMPLASTVLILLRTSTRIVDRQASLPSAHSSTTNTFAPAVTPSSAAASSASAACCCCQCLTSLGSDPSSSTMSCRRSQCSVPASNHVGQATACLTDIYILLHCRRGTAGGANRLRTQKDRFVHQCTCVTNVRPSRG